MRQRKDQLKNSLPKGKALAIIMMREVFGNLLINLRAPSNKFKWDGDWAFESDRWDENIIQSLGSDFQYPRHYDTAEDESREANFWVSFQEAVIYFKSLCVCRVFNWNEVRFRGKFLRLKDAVEHLNESIHSKWYYSIKIEEPSTRVIITLH